MERNEKRITIATIIELSARTISKVAIKNTRRGFNETSAKSYAQIELSVRDELTSRGMVNV